MVTSAQHLYNNPEAQTIPSSYNLVVGYEPELYYFMRYKLNMNETETQIYTDNAVSLFNADVKSMQTLLNPVNL